MTLKKALTVKILSKKIFLGVNRKYISIKTPNCIDYIIVVDDDKGNGNVYNGVVDDYNAIVNDYIGNVNDYNGIVNAYNGIVNDYNAIVNLYDHSLTRKCIGKILPFLRGMSYLYKSMVCIVYLLYFMIKNN